MILKEFSEFHKNKRSPDGYKARCKSCRNIENKEHREQNPNYYKKWRDDNKDKMKDYSAQYQKANKEQLKTKKLEYIKQNKELVDARKKAWYERNKERIIKKKKERYDNDPERFRNESNQYSKNNRLLINKKHKERYSNDPEFNIKVKLRRRIQSALKKQRISKSDITINLLGCSYKEYQKYIESKFVDGMTWEKVLNGEIHIDHIMPCASFNLMDPEQQKKCFHYTNLQPLWAEDNLRKGAKLPK